MPVDIFENVIQPDSYEKPCNHNAISEGKDGGKWRGYNMNFSFVRFRIAKRERCMSCAQTGEYRMITTNNAMSGP
jgi:hypothetical protein